MTPDERIVELRKRYLRAANLERFGSMGNQQTAYEFWLERLVLLLEGENSTLRMITTKIMPCHYCGVDDIAKCPHGFPGCSLADDIATGEDAMAAEIQKLRNEISECAMMINVAGPLGHRIKILQTENGETIRKLEAKVRELQETLENHVVLNSDCNCIADHLAHMHAPLCPVHGDNATRRAIYEREKKP